MSFGRTSCIALALAASTVGLPAQCGCPHGPYYTTRMQQQDGSWSAIASGGQPEAALRVTALLLLAKVGLGTRLQPVAENLKGSEREHEPDSLKKGVAWLRRQQDQKGRIALRTDPGWLLDHAIATYVLTETVRTSAVAELAPDACKATEALRRQLENTRPKPGPEVRLWAAMIERSLRAVASSDMPEEPRAATRATAAALATTLAALPAVAAVSPREQAAECLQLLLAGGQGKPPDPAWLEDPLRDPLTGFYAFVAWWQRGGKEWTDASKRINAAVIKTRVRDGEHSESWEPVGDFGAENGRFGTTAAALLLAMTWYRHSCLEVLD